MNRRRIMMLQQSKKYEIIYDAASGLLPTQCGWKIARQNSLPTMQMIDGVCALTCTDGLFLEPIDNPFASNCSIEAEFCLSHENQGLALFLNDGVSNLNFLIGTNAVNGILIYQQWGNNLYRQDRAEWGVYYTAKMQRRGNKFYCYLNDKLIYSGEVTGNYSTLQDGFNISGHNQTYIKKIIYAVY